VNAYSRRKTLQPSEERMKGDVVTDS
jgi:hypothetical protein